MKRLTNTNPNISHDRFSECAVNNDNRDTRIPISDNLTGSRSASNGIKVALTHDYRKQRGGEERVLETLAEIFPKAPIYTLFYDKDKTLGKFDGKIKKTSFLDFPLVRNRHRPFIPLMPIAASAMKINGDYDVIISDSAGYAKGMRASNYVDKKPLHISYCHTPLRYAWEPEYINAKFQIPSSKFIGKKAFGGVSIALLASPFINTVAWLLRVWDRRAGQKPDILLANSNFIAQKIKKYYGREAQVVYPPVDLKIFYPDKDKQIAKGESYFLAVGRFMHYKRFDIVVDAFNKLGFPVKIIGYGPEEKNLKSMAQSPRIEFMSYQGNAELRKLYSGARALIFPQVEDFGLVAAEAIACGTPVIAYNAGGAKEIVDEKSGILFDKQTTAGLMEAIRIFMYREKKFKPSTVAVQAQKFSKENFVKQIKDIVAGCLLPIS